MWGAIFIAISSYRERAHPSNVSEFKNMFDHYGSDNGDTLLVNAIQSSVNIFSLLLTCTVYNKNFCSSNAVVMKNLILWNLLTELILGVVAVPQKIRVFIHYLQMVVCKGYPKF